MKLLNEPAIVAGPAILTAPRALREESLEPRNLGPMLRGRPVRMPPEFRLGGNSLPNFGTGLGGSEHFLLQVGRDCGRTEENYRFLSRHSVGKATYNSQTLNPKPFLRPPITVTFEHCDTPLRILPRLPPSENNARYQARETEFERL